MEIPLEDIKQRIEVAIGLIYDNDLDLFTRSNYEVTISCKLSQYLYDMFPRYDVDCEYNKHWDWVKRVDSLESEVRPDILIHRRWHDRDNLVYIEIKKEQNRESRNKDYQKLIALTAQWGKFKYRLWVFIDFHPKRVSTNVHYFMDWKVFNYEEDLGLFHNRKIPDIFRK